MTIARDSAAVAVAALVLVSPAGGGEPGKFNVLFLAIDDWRPEAGCYGSPLVKTPHIDRLAARGTTFLRAYCQQAVCSPSRTSLLTGRRPDTTKVFDLVTHFRRHLPDVVTLPQHFRAHGYVAQGFSKIFHLEDRVSWSVPPQTPRAPTYGQAATLADLERRKEDRQTKIEAAKQAGEVWDWKKRGEKWYVFGPAWEDRDVADDALTDGKTAAAAIDALRQLKDQRFFLAVGFLKPHLPFVAPKKHYDLYRRADLKLAPNPNPPRDCPPMSAVDLGELRNYHGTPYNLPIPDELALDLIHGYLACTSYMDAQVGRLLYDHKIDPGENVNAVDHPGNKALVATLSAQLRAGWRAARPKPAPTSP